MTTGLIGPGVHQGLPLAEYLKLPAVSASILRAVVERCPAAGFYESWLNETHVPEDEDSSVTEAEKKRRGLGSVAHSILLEASEDCCVVIDPEDHPAERTGSIPDGWTNKSIRAARDDARARGKIPVLLADMAEIRAMAASARRFIDGLRDTEPAIWKAFEPDGGSSEVTMLWAEDLNGSEHLCRLRADRISSDAKIIVDAKFTARSAEPGSWGRTQLLGMGYYMSAAWYRRGVRALCDVDCTYYFLVVETAPPYLCSLIGVDPTWIALGESKVKTGLAIWDRCKRDGVFPAYPNRACFPELPPWAGAVWQEQEAANVGGIPYDLDKLFQKKAAA